LSFINCKNMTQNRVVITGLGVCAPNGIGLTNFLEALQKGQSGIRHFKELEELNFRCHVGGEPQLTPAILEANFSPLEQKRLSALGLMYGAIAAQEAWLQAGLTFPDKEAEPLWRCGTVFGTGLSGVHTLRDAIYKTDQGQVKRLGGSVVEQTMPSGISAFLSGKLGLGNWVSSNSSACSTGTESIIMAASHIKNGQADIMLAGGCDSGGAHSWGGFDAMRVLNSKHNQQPQQASRPMAADASGFVPGSGGGALVLESFASAERRGATIYAEVLGGHVNSGGQRGNGSMTAPNAQGTQKCIKGALAAADVTAQEIDLICGHLTSTMGDVLEIQNWSKALDLRGAQFPKINALKSMTGHCLSAAGAIESVAAILQMEHNFQHASLNCQYLHPSIAETIDKNQVVQEYTQAENRIIAKSSFGFGDVNSCVIFKKWNND
jgi:3-oxoacyl-(acyl-carrier-protein) synthase